MKASVTGWPVWSPNGTNPEQVLTRVQSFKFVPTNNGIYYIRTEETAQDKVIATLPFTYTQAGLDLSPVGKTLLFAPLEQTDGDLMSVQIQPCPPRAVAHKGLLKKAGALTDPIRDDRRRTDRTGPRTKRHSSPKINRRCLGRQLLDV